MTILQLKENYSSHDLSYYPGDRQLRYKLFAPLFINLHENKLVYRERFIGIIKVEDVVITPERFQATAVPYLLIERNNRFDKFFFRKPKWTFCATWDHMRLIDNSINVPYANWTVWCEPELVKEVEQLTIEKNYREAVKRTL